MPKPLVFWRTDEADDYIHTEKDCVEIADAKTVQCGSIEDAKRCGHTRACPYCQRARNLPEKKETAVVKSNSGAPAVQKATVWIATLAAVACTWLFCWLYYNDQSIGIRNAAYDEGYTAAATEYESEYENRYREGYDTGKENGYNYGKREGYNSGYTEGYTKGKNSVDTSTSYNEGYEKGKASVDTSTFYNNGYNAGYNDGYSDGSAKAATSSQSTYNSNSSSYSYNYTVYITATGSKYHSAGCQYLKKSCYSISLSDAIAQGYTACSRCNP